MTYITVDVDIGEHLHEASTDDLVAELETRDGYTNQEALINELVQAHHCGTMTADQVVKKLYDLLDRPYCK